MSETALRTTSVTVDEAASALHDAWRADQVPPLPSSLMDDLDEPTAYRIQATYVRMRLDADAIAGYKAGATVPAARSNLGLAAPMSGVLLRSGCFAGGSTVPLERFGALLMETEIGYRLGRTVSEPIADVAALRDVVATAFPVFELADTGFYRTAPSLGPDLIASNAAANALVMGAEVEAGSLDPDALTVALARDGVELYRASTATTLDGQWPALLWLVNRMLAQGYRLEAGHILLTGALGVPQRAEPGHYRADYGPLGSVEFRLGA